MSLNPRLTLIGMYEYDNSLFDNVSFPEGISKETAINTILLNYGECPVIYPRYATLKAVLGIWSSKWSEALERIYEALTASYNPIYNYDRHEESSDTENVTGSGTNSSTNTRTDNLQITDNIDREDVLAETTENKISAENESVYSPDTQTVHNSTVTSDEDRIGTQTGTVTNAASGTTSDEREKANEHEAHLYGNIGVTTSQQMILEELSLRTMNNIYDIIAELFFREICLYYY